MASTISWLDFSPEEQRHNRELAELFRQTEGREELGLGQIRDSLSDGLFPGTSTLHTRARYLLFIPWIFQRVSEHRGSTGDAQREERKLIETLVTEHPHESGIIGGRAGKTLKTLPSNVYWSALGQYEILTNPRFSREKALSVQADTLADAVAPRDDDGEPLGTIRAWRNGIPNPPEGFPNTVPGGMRLSLEEALWLQERIIDSAPDSLLAYLMMNRPHKDSKTPWQDPVALQVPGNDAWSLLHHAERFSNTMHGAQLLYNLLIAETYERHGFEQREGRVEHFRAAFEQWAITNSRTLRSEVWNVDEFFIRILTIRQGRPVSQLSERFVREWARLLEHTDPGEMLTSDAARTLVRDQERYNKRKLARIDVPSRLETWGGSSGSGQYTYRWDFVQRLLTDVHDSLEPAMPEEAYAATS